MYVYYIVFKINFYVKSDLSFTKFRYTYFFKLVNFKKPVIVKRKTYKELFILYK